MHRRFLSASLKARNKGKSQGGDASPHSKEEVKAAMHRRTPRSPDG
jgi:hypothetical protein